jgi:plastocyanin domain-containing protein
MSRLPVIATVCVLALLLTAIAARAATEPRAIKIEVTTEGFVPAAIKVRKGEPLKLLVTRRTDKTCATEIVIKEKNIRVALPLNETVTIPVTFEKAGKVRYACGMDMIAGVFIVE